MSFTSKLLKIGIAKKGYDKAKQFWRKKKRKESRRSPAGEARG